MIFPSWIRRLAIAAILASTANGTTIIIARTPANVVISADSLESIIRSLDDRLAQRNQCKIRVHGQIVFAVAGLVGLTNLKGFSAYDFIESALSRAGTPALQVASINEGLRSFWLEHSVDMKSTNRPALDFMLRPAPFLTTTFAFLDSGVPTTIVTVFNARADTSGAVTIQTRELSCPGLCRTPDLPYLVVSGVAGALHQALAASKQIPVMDLPLRLEQMVETEIAADPANVGPPISTIILDASGPHWYEGHHGACPAQLK